MYLSQWRNEVMLWSTAKRYWGFIPLGCTVNSYILLPGSTTLIGSRWADWWAYLPIGCV